MNIVLFLVSQIFKIWIETTGLIELKLPKEIPDLFQSNMAATQQVIVEDGYWIVLYTILIVWFWKSKMAYTAGHILI